MSGSLSLAPVNTATGAFQRLFLAETLTPAWPTYESADSLRAMRLMRRMVENRLRLGRQYGAPKGARTIIDVISSDRELRGFGGYSVLLSAITQRVDESLRIDNAAKDRRSPEYGGFVENAILASTEVSPPPEANIPNNVVGWRTIGRGSPGKNDIPAAVAQGNTFFTAVGL